MSATREFLEYIHNHILIPFLVSEMTYWDFSKAHVDRQKEVSQRIGLRVEEMDSRAFLFSDGAAEDKNTTLLAILQQGQLREICIKNGFLIQELIKMLIVMLYSMWESEYREAIARELGLKEINVDIFGDIRLLRHCIVHTKGIADRDLVTKAKIIKGLEEGKNFKIDGNDFRKIIETIVVSVYSLHGNEKRRTVSPLPKYWLKTIFDPDYYKNLL